MLFFRSEDHVRRWCEARGREPGAVLSLDQAWRLADGWYRNKLRADWRRHTLEETEELLRSIGLAGPFWDLR